MVSAVELIKAASAAIVEEIVLPPRPEVRALPPLLYRSGAAGALQREVSGGHDELYRHQALAEHKIAQGEHVVIATGTASGKTLPYHAATIHELSTGSGKALILFPQKALASDQLARMRRALELAGLQRDLVGEINGDVAQDERDRVLAECRIILATPDAIHSWMMRQVHSPLVQRFLSELRFLVIDEAHSYDGVFGSNSAYFFRRLRSAQQSAHRRLRSRIAPLQLIAASATISDPAMHLEQLTGCSFSAITEADNGAPFHGLTLLHIDGPAYGAPAEKALADICGTIAANVAPHAFIAFADSRQGVEHITRVIDRDDVDPYRGGYEGRDRRKIEADLRANRLRGVVSTSALELGIDIPQFVVGLNLGVPQTRKALRQRVGRIGRTMPGAFALIAPASAFAQLGGTFREFFEGEVEPSHLYLENRFIQFQAARCLIDECGIGDGAHAPR
jgi:DEAD/DEAH box helicase domain-containing protein